MSHCFAQFSRVFLFSSLVEAVFLRNAEDQQMLLVWSGKRWHNKQNDEIILAKISSFF